MFFVFQKFETMIFVVYQKTTNIEGYFFQTLVFQENFLLEMKIKQNEPFVKKFEHYKNFYQK